VKYTNHFIVCGYGRIGCEVVRELIREKHTIVVIDRVENQISSPEGGKVICIVGDPAVNESLLEQAGLAHAQGLIITVGDDADAIFIAISARAIRPDLAIVARASTPQTAEKLRKIGVNHAVIPSRVGGFYLAAHITRPGFARLLDQSLDHEQAAIGFGEVVVKEGGSLIGVAMRDLDEHMKGCLIVAVVTAEGAVITGSDANHKLGVGDRLILVGPQEKIEATFTTTVVGTGQKKDSAKRVTDIKRG
jgi:voltage-gated potassium channel